MEEYSKTIIFSVDTISRKCGEIKHHLTAAGCYDSVNFSSFVELTTSQIHADVTMTVSQDFVCCEEEWRRCVSYDTDPHDLGLTICR